jgi:uncharacterized membrane protein
MSARVVAVVAGGTVVVVGACLAVFALMLSTIFGNLTSETETTAPVVPIACIPIIPGTDASTGYLDRTEQVRNATTIIAVGKQLQIPPRGLVVAIATAMQESRLLNLASHANRGSLAYPHDGVAPGDHDSVGLFQQRDAWGSMYSRMTPALSARMFYTGGAQGQRGLLDIKGWENMSIAQAAQSVQVSAFPDAYAQWETLAVATVNALGDVEVGTGCAEVAAGPWTNPLAGHDYRKSAGFGQCSRLWENCHTGQDMAIAPGTPVVAASAGRVTHAGPGGAYGNLVKIQHADQVQTWYAHLSRTAVTPGATVQPGAVIGYVGSTGNTTGPHLHFEVRLRDEPIDPAPFMAGKGADL